jgi:hypothetical protein
MSATRFLRGSGGELGRRLGSAIRFAIESAARANEPERLLEHYRSLLARLSGPTPPPDVELLAFLRDAGVPATDADRVILHVGFGHSATTSLQHAFFRQRDDIHYAGLPYGNAGGLFSHLKYTEDHLLDAELLTRECRNWLYGDPARNGRPIVVSDEMLTEPPEIYYHPHLLPGPQVAARLKLFFPIARIVFTIRRQADYVPSLYFNLKRNYAYLAGMPMPPFEEWWHGVMHTQVRGAYLLNLDYAPLIRVYSALFGRENILVLPLEKLKSQGDREYLGTLCEFMNVPLRDRDLEHFRVPHNQRMTVVEDRVAELLAARQSESAVREAFSNEKLTGLMGQAPRATLELSEQIRSEIADRVAKGNRWLAETFALPLAEWGYAT